ncbi:MAG: hypothetical protein ACLQUS_10090 [Desulfobaccales bacterium]
MVILPNVNIYRVEYENPWPPNVGPRTFYAAGHSIEEVIQELCISQNINPSLVRERAVISKLHCLTSTLLDKLITQNLEMYNKRKELQKIKYDEFMDKNPTKPVNSSKVNDDINIFSVLN